MNFSKVFIYFANLYSFLQFYLQYLQIAVVYTDNIWIGLTAYRTIFAFQLTNLTEVEKAVIPKFISSCIWLSL